MKLTIILFLFCSLSLSAQKDGNNSETEEIKIENGAITKKFNKGKLESFTVEINANSYYNSFLFTKKNDTIIATNLSEEKAVIKIYVKDKKKVSEFFYNGRILFYQEAIDFNTTKLPPNGRIWGTISNAEKTSYLFYRDNLSKAQGDDFEKTYKLYSFLKTAEYNVTSDLLFNEIADFFSEEDAILKIYLSSYRNKIISESKLLKVAYLTTNGQGQIKNGVLWTQKSDLKGEYKLFENQKNIKTENIDLDSFQGIFNDYYILNLPVQD